MESMAMTKSRTGAQTGGAAALLVTGKAPRLPRETFAQGLLIMGAIPAWRFDPESEITRDVYWSTCCDLHPRDFVRALRDLTRSSKWLPTPSEIRAAAELYAWRRRARRPDREAEARRAAEKADKERRAAAAAQRMADLERDSAAWGAEPATTPHVAVERILRVLGAYFPDVLERLEPYVNAEDDVRGTPARPELIVRARLDAHVSDCLRRAAGMLGVRLTVYVSADARVIA